MSNPSKFWRLMVRFRSAVLAISAFVTILILPLKINQLPAALQWWATKMPTRETLWMVLSGALVAWVVWIDVRPLVLGWWQRHIENIEEDGRTRNLVLRFGPTPPWSLQLEGVLLQTNASGMPIRGRARWFCVEVHNPTSGTIAHGCRAYVKDIEFSQSPCGPFEATNFGSSQRLRWSKVMEDDGYGPRDIAHSERCFVDLLSTDHLYPTIGMKWRGEWVEHAGLFSRNGTYRITVVASSDDAGEGEIKLLATWNGKWDEVEISEEERTT